MSLILFGFQGTGKSYFGKLLAEKLGRPFIDTDTLLSPTLSARELFKSVGEAEFRRLETQALLRLHPPEDAVIALGGGTVLDPKNVTLLQRLGHLVYLQAEFETIGKREMLRDVPAFAAPDRSLHQIFQARLPIYEAIPARKVKIDGLNDKSILTALRAVWDELHRL